MKPRYDIGGGGGGDDDDDADGAASFPLVAI